MTMAWGLASLIVLSLMCALPYGLHAQVKAIHSRWHQQLGSLTWRQRLPYRWAQTWAWLVASGLFALGASYLYLVGVYVGAIVR